jgi:hypothetical protein
MKETRPIQNKKIDDAIVESWLCVDCGVNTAPGVPNGATVPCPSPPYFRADRSRI